MNRYGVGGLVLQDVGERMSTIWKRHGCYDDITGYGTRVGVGIQAMETEFIGRLCKDDHNMYRVVQIPLSILF